MGKQNILDHLENDWQALIDSLEGLSDKEMLEPGVCGQWSVRDILGHISTWEEQAMQNIPLILAGEPTPRYTAVGGITGFNEHAQDDKKEYTLSRIKRDFRATHQRFSTYLSALPEAAYNNNARLAKRIRLDGYGHYTEHTRQITAWRDSRATR
jgi:uncharacterized damage-inducible protein DinB